MESMNEKWKKQRMKVKIDQNNNTYFEASLVFSECEAMKVNN